MGHIAQLSISSVIISRSSREEGVVCLCRVEVRRLPTTSVFRPPSSAIEKNNHRNKRHMRICCVFAVDSEVVIVKVLNSAVMFYKGINVSNKLSYSYSTRDASIRRTRSV